MAILSAKEEEDPKFKANLSHIMRSRSVLFVGWGEGREEKGREGRERGNFSGFKSFRLNC